MQRANRGRVPLVLVLLGLSLALSLATVARADNNPLATVDENGVGTLQFPGRAPIPMPGILEPDPGPGGLPAVLTYNLLGPPDLTAGDVFLVDPGIGLNDVVRFNPAGTGGNPAYPASLLFYSDNVPTFDALGDTSSPPLASYANTITIDELGNELNNGAIYTPSKGQPGYVDGFGVTYNLISDGTGFSPVPEPSSMILLGSGLTGLAALVRRKKSKAGC